MSRKSHFLFLLFVFLVTTGLSAQDERTKIKVRMSSDADASDKLIASRLIRTHDNSIVVLKAKATGVSLMMIPIVDLEYRLDLYTMDKIELVRSIEPNLRSSVGQTALEDIVMFGGKPLLIGSQRLKDEKRFRLLWQEFDPRLTRNNAPLQEFASIDYAKSTKGFPFMGAEAAPFGFMTKLSPDSTKMLIYSPEMSTEDKQAVHFFMVVNERMETLWEHFVVSEVKGTRSALLDVEVTNDGTATAWVKNKFGNRDVKKGVIDFESRIHRMGPDGHSENTFKMDGAHYPVDVDLLGLEDGSMVCAGVYGSLDEKKDKTPGSFIAVWEAKGDRFEQRGHFEFPTFGKNNDKLYEEMVVADLLRGTDGRFHLVTEVSYSYQSTVSSGTGGSRTVTKYVNGDMIAHSFDTKGNLEWMSTLPRYINTTAYYLGNSQAVLFDDQLHILFIDDENNIERRKKGERLEKGIDAKDCRSMIVSFDDAGKYRTKIVLVSDKNADYLAGTGVFQVDKGTFFTYGQRKLGSSKLVPVKVEFSKDSR
ncbi:MAG: hypothetical protein KDB95_11530 [Flavobacteriales bacterium]|nr:hypothetical protein [Flavobacteriales bacterium]